MKALNVLPCRATGRSFCLPAIIPSSVRNVHSWSRFDGFLHSSSQISWEVLMVDEGHRLKNADSKLFDILSGYAFRQRLLLTGASKCTPTDRGWCISG